MTDVPVPPFADFAAAQLFHRLLLLHVREIKRPGEPVGLHQFLLGQALSWHAPRGGDACADCDPPGHTYACQHAGPQPGGGAACAQCGPPYPCRTLVSVAAVSRFGVPWTPLALTAVLRTAGLLPPFRLENTDEPGRLEIGGDGWADPIETAVRDDTGHWTLTRSERGSSRTVDVGDDAAIVAALLDRARTHAFPYGWRVEPDWAGSIGPGAAAAGEWWEEHAGLRYLENERGSGAL
ncbi:MAG TPA: hypothetical protein VGF17_30320 [Phytomonospora sp.]